jgi:hypothetical protein
VRIAAVQHRAEATDEHRMSQAGEQRRLAAKRFDGPLVLDAVRAQDLRYKGRVQPLVPDEEDLVAVTSPERLEG